MTTRTQGVLMTEIRNKLNSLNTRRFSDSQVRTWINEGIADITRRSECNRTSTTIAVSAGTQEYTGPTDAVRIHMVQYNRTGDTQKYDLQYMDVKNMSSIGYTSVETTQGTPACFWTWGYPPNLKINLYPIPSAAGSLKVFYYSIPVPLAIDSNSDQNTSVNVPQGWEDLIVDYATYQGLLSDANPRWQTYKQEYESKFTGIVDAASRYIDQAGMIANGNTMVPAWLYAGDY